MIPKAEHLDSSFGKELIALFVPCPLIGKAMTTAIKFNWELCERTIEIEEADAARILPAKFELIEAVTTKQTPEPSFGIGGLPA